MNKEASHILIDVIALSKQLCTYPIDGELAYATTKNFIGRVIDGYSPNAQDVCLMTKQAALALCKVQNNLLKNKLSLYICDAYRPLRAVKDFARWYHEPTVNKIEIDRKKIHYPNLEKTDLVRLGYAPETISRHNFGHAVDLMLIHIDTKTLLDMGGCFDFFDELSHSTVTKDQIGAEAHNNRMILSKAMQKYNFIPYKYEFWHFDYEIRETDEPIDIPIVTELRNLNVD